MYTFKVLFTPVANRAPSLLAAAHETSIWSFLVSLAPKKHANSEIFVDKEAIMWNITWLLAWLDILPKAMGNFAPLTDKIYYIFRGSKNIIWSNYFQPRKFNQIVSFNPSMDKITLPVKIYF